MYHISSYELAKARVADHHHQAQRDALARATRRARRARRARPHQSGHPVPAFPFYLTRAATSASTGGPHPRATARSHSAQQEP